MLSYCIFWLTIIFYIILCESASIRREAGVPASYFSAGRWRPGRPLKRSLLYDYGNNQDTAEVAVGDHSSSPPAAASAFGVADSLGPPTDGHSKISSSSPIVYLPELNFDGNDSPMLLADGFGSSFQSPIDGSELSPIEENALFLMLNSNGEKYISNEALNVPQQQQSYIIPENSFQSPPSINKPVVIQHQQKTTAALSSAPRL